VGLKRKTKIISAIVTVFYLTGFVFAIEAIMTARTETGALAWSISLATVQFVTVKKLLPQKNGWHLQRPTWRNRFED